MSYKEQTEKANDADEAKGPDFTKLRAEARKFLATLSIFDFLDPSKPWVLVPDGSFLNCFDFVPPVFRQGSWGVIPTVFLTGVVYLVFLSTFQKYATEGIQDLPSVFYPAFSVPWWCNLANFLWTSYVLRDVFLRGPGIAALGTFTVQSYSLLMLRCLLSAISPFCPSLASYNELLRYPVLNQACITFFVWNFILAPVLYTRMKTPQQRKSFIKYFTNFRLMQLHFFNIFLAVFSGVYGTPPRPFVWTDRHVALLLGLQYTLFYAFILDRLGVHLYMIFSPRTNLSILAWSIVLGVTVYCYTFWDAFVNRHGQYWDRISWAY